MDEDVEMEFISVMGVLVPIELTKGVSCEAKRFAAGDVSSNDEAPEIVEDPIPDTNLNHDVSTNSEHTETKCNHTGCTNFAETQGKGSEPTHCEVAEAKDTTVTIEDKSVDHKNDHVAAVGTQKSCLVGEVEVETGKLKGMAGSTQMTKKSQVKNHNGLRSEVRTQKTREKNRQQERGSKKCRGQEKHRRPNVEPGVIDIKKSKRNPTKDEAKGNSPFDGMKQSTKSCKRKAQTVKTKVAVVQPTNVLESTSDAKEKPTAANSRTTVAVSRSSSIAVSKSKRQVKRPRITEDEASTKSGLLKQRELVSVAGEVRIRNTWKLRSDDEAYDKSSEQTKLRTSTPATNTPSDSTKDTVKMTNSNEQGRCAYPGCTQPARYKCRCAEHNGRARCSLPDCVKFAHSGGKCIAHGGGALCTEAGCTTRARSKGKCYAHGGGIVCSHPECTTRAKTKGKCVAHGGGTFCSETGCDKLVISDRKCIAHGGWIKCSHPGCSNRAHLRRKCKAHDKVNTATGATDMDKRPGKSTVQSAEVTVHIDDTKSTQHATEVSGESAPPQIHAVESDGARKILGPTTKRLRNCTTTDSTEVASVKEGKARAKWRRKCSVAEAASVEHEAMSLRSGQRITRITGNRYDRQSEDEALQKILKLSEVEY